MKAIGKLKKERGLWMFDAPNPQKIHVNEVLIKVKKTAICGTDIHIYHWDEWAQKTIPVPMITGHEFFGIVEEVGSLVKHIKKGDRVSGEGHIVCEVCQKCRSGYRNLCSYTKGVGVNIPGCFAEYIILPANNVCVLPEAISDNVASFLDPLGNAVHTTLCFDIVAENVLITGAGPIGIMSALIAQHVGAKNVVITDINEYRLNLAKQSGIKHCENTTKIHFSDLMKTLHIDAGFDVALENSGSSLALNQILEEINYGGKIALLGILPKTAIDWTQVIFKSLTLRGIYGRLMYETWYKMTSLLESGLDVSGIITHEFRAEEFQKALDIIETGKCGKVILNW